MYREKLTVMAYLKDNTPPLPSFLLTFLSHNSIYEILRLRHSNKRTTLPDNSDDQKGNLNTPIDNDKRILHFRNIYGEIKETSLESRWIPSPFEYPILQTIL
jgi:hypothetical protein